MAPEAKLKCGEKVVHFQNVPHLLLSDLESDTVLPHAYYAFPGETCTKSVYLNTWISGICVHRFFMYSNVTCEHHLTRGFNCRVRFTVLIH